MDRVPQQLDDYQLAQLTAQMECYIHTHPRLVLDQISSLELQEATPVMTVTTGEMLNAAHDQVAIDPAGTNVTLLLPPALKSKEYHITMTGTGKLTITPYGADTIVGDTSVVVEEQWTSLHLKATTGNWLII